MAERDRSHIFLAQAASVEEYSSYGAGGGGTEVPGRDRSAHGGRLARELSDESAKAFQRREDAEQLGLATSGIHLTFESFPGLELALESLENRSLKRPPELLAVRTVETDEGTVQMATVYIPDEAVANFVKKLEQYIAEDTSSGKPKNRNLVDRIAAIRLATLESLWTEPAVPFPAADTPYWWEAWLRRDDGNELTRFLAFVSAVEAQAGARRLGFQDRTVVLVRATVTQLARSVDVLDDLAELRQARAPSAFFVGLQASEQRAWIDELLTRTTFASQPDAPRVCVLDSGVRADHPLLRPALDPADVQTVDPAWGTADDQGHGSEMAGLALFGDSLAEHLSSNEPIAIVHALESVKILPRPPAHNDPDLYGAITAEAIGRVEVQAPDRKRAFSLAVTAALTALEHGHAYGQPTSWSSALDALTVGRTFVSLPGGLDYLDFQESPQSRLIVVAAGNIEADRWDVQHLDRSDVEPVEDPAQAWNVLTVGAYTNLVDPGSFTGHTPLAPAGELSPISRTSVPFSRQWASKPDVLLEGGNLAASPSNELHTPDSMHLLTTHGRDASRLLTFSNGTSAATAQAARMAAQVWAEYPALWPETVRALIVHGANWTPTMQNRFDHAGSRTEVENLLRRYGMGVPQLDRVLYSAKNDLALVTEQIIHPFSQGKLREMHMHELPWPVEQLEQLGEAPVRMRVTLSYFVEPNPSRRGWAGRFRYASHGLRFDVKSATESVDDLRKRLNKQALEEEENRPTGTSDATEWILGPRVRNRGSIHSDIWTGTAAALASKGYVVVYPISGWWKELKGRDRSDLGAKYTLVISIEAPDVEVDLWTTINTKIQVATEIGIV